MSALRLRSADRADVGVEFQESLPPAEGDGVRLQVHACALGALDVEVASGKWSPSGEAGSAPAAAVVAPLSPPPPFGLGLAAAGVVVEAGPAARGLKPGDRAVALVPLDDPVRACGHETLQSCHHVFPVPSPVRMRDAAALAGPGLFAAAVLYYKLKAVPGESVHLLSPSSPEANVLAQLCACHDVRPVAVARTLDELHAVASLSPSPFRAVLDATARALDEAVLQETGGVGADYLVECLPADESESEKEALELLGTLVRCLAPHGHWVTTHRAMQLPPAVSTQLFLRNASLSFVFPQTWLLAPLQQGRLLHVMHDLMEKLAAGKLSPPPATAREVPLKHAADAFRELCEAGRGFLLVSPTPAGAE